ncbi:hypothetical protein TREMEDRAFT_42080 [Tremella mesenterica DSM 1558]|uniref:uncharacterized protein n=1 Tax=Tremella mesenterica (strain ATCC 24925 / CBS 8224 / DSM 1558 / NBRC 9311 / NRRL Y-6157 / RJB 2259-6 / UBC 559-6) TaxID=578456 RepID=UPI0003F4A14C|nr:uncharacterized protein TREMEDRAFT_42080 [Tremella mesenterica DSM 1558]EIW72914.1 hypothetical protein TREMEDRAFT_42080 [Tremella mesenterica DSM 1558]
MTMRGVLRPLSGLVIRCFKRVEAFADWITGAAGPVFVGLCWTLIGLGGIIFFDVVVRDLSWFTTLLLSPILFIIPANLYGQYFLVCVTPPGYPSPRALALSPNKPVHSRRDSWLVHSPRSVWSPERWGMTRRNTRPLTGEGNVNVTPAPQGRVRRCRKCDGPKPERTHHCSVCKRCILLMDHHCPWINGCVGLHNQRHFVLFMAWLSFATWVVSLMGYSRFWDSFDFREPWPGMSPRIAYTLLYVLSLAIGFCVPVLLLWHLYMVSKGETSVESHDNAYLETRAKAEGLIYLNPYDLGKKRNLELFFNIGSGGYPKRTLLLPLTIPPWSNGWSYPRRQLPLEPHLKPTMHLHAPELADGLISSPSAENGMLQSRYVMGDGGDLTDDEEGGGGWMDD